MLVAAIALLTWISEPTEALARSKRARAQKAPAAATNDDAVTRYRRALVHYKAGRFDAAAEDFHAAFALQKKAVFLFNAARSEHRAGKLKLAAGHYRQLLKRKAVPAKMAARAGELMVKVESEFRAREAREAADEAESKRRLELRQQREQQQSNHKLISFGLTGGGVAVLGAGGWLVASALSDQQALDDKVAKRSVGGSPKITGLSYEEYAAEQDRLDRNHIVAGVTAAAGAIATGIGVWMLLNPPVEANAVLLPTGNGAVFRVEF